MTATLQNPAPTLPDGFRIRPATPQDIPSLIANWKIISTDYGIPEELTPEDVQSNWSHPAFDLAASTRVGLNPAGDIVAYICLSDTLNPPVKPRLDLEILPDYIDSGIAEYLFHWAEETAMRVLDRVPADAKVTYATAILSTYEPYTRLFQSLGYEETRFWQRMVMDLHEQLPAPQFPDGISVRSMAGLDELRDVLAAMDEAFEDHFGHVQRPLDDIVEQWMHRLQHDSLFDPAMYWMAIDDETGEIAGVCLTRREEWGAPDHAYVNGLGVRPAYRKHGLGLALLRHAFQEYQRRGTQKLALHVDADSITGATRLYEKAGMRVHYKWAEYNKVLREGVQLARTE